ncbi:MAG: hypothetical protein C5B58_08475 [Acidobacteria bacterium]|nr:MAG: hypothetical protein C5B58_08475 [Acidobacteriota bacterium]
MSLTEQIIEIVDQGRSNGTNTGELNQALYAIGCTRISHRIGILVAYYYDADDEERFVICTL